MKDKESKMDNNIRNNRESKMQENIKLDSNGDEIVWELKRKINFFIILAYIFYLCIIVGFTYMIIYKIPDIDIRDWKSILICLFLIFGIAFFSRQIYYSLNLKRMYVAKNKLFINKYLGQDLRLPLDEIMIFEKRAYTGNLAGVSTHEIASISHHTKVYYFFIESNSTNTDEIKPILKPYIVDYLLKCDEKSYYEFTFYYSKVEVLYQYDIDYNVIDNLRKEKDNEK